MFKLGGVSVRPSTKTDISITRTEVTRLEHPFKSNCSNKWPSWLEPGGTDFMEFPYTSKLCINLCIEEAMGRACNCSFLPYMEISRTTYRYNQATEQLYDW